MTFNDDQLRADRERDANLREAQERAVASLHARVRAITSARRLAAAVAGDMVILVAAGGPIQVRRVGPHRLYSGGSISPNRYVDGVPVRTITLYECDEDGRVRAAADLTASLLHELGHGLLGHDYGELEASALAAALAEHFEPELNAPLADVLAELSAGLSPTATDGR